MPRRTLQLTVTGIRFVSTRARDSAAGMIRVSELDLAPRMLLSAPLQRDELPPPSSMYAKVIISMLRMITPRVGIDLEVA